MPSLDIAANTRLAQRNVQQLGEALDDVGGSLDDVARDGAKAGDKIERTFTDMVRDAKRADTAIEKVGDSGTKGFGKASQAGTEFKEEALSNFSEVTSSFDGSMSSIQDLAQGTLGGLASTGLPGVGLAAGAAAIGVGLIGAALEDAEVKRQRLQDRAAALSAAYIEAGSTVLDELTRVGRFADALQDPETRKEAEALSKLLGGDLSLAVRVLTGDEKALSEARVIQAARMEDQTIAGVALKTALDEQSGVLRQAKDDARLVSDEYLRMINTSGGATEQVDKLGNAVYTLPGGRQIVVNAETGEASENLETFKGDLDEIPKTKVTRVRVEVDDSAWINWKPKIKEGIVQGKPASGRYWE